MRIDLTSATDIMATAIATVPAVTLSPPSSYPTAGIGGSYYDTPFYVPVYNSTDPVPTSWRTLDKLGFFIAYTLSPEGIAAGLAWATLIYVLALTPNRKRTTLFHSILLFGLIFLLTHYMIDLIAAQTPGISTQAFYLLVTGDYASSKFPSSFTAAWVISLVMECLALICACTCLWLQAKGLLSGIRLSHTKVYRGILTYLILASLTAVGGRVAYMTSHLKWLRTYRPDWAADVVDQTAKAYGITSAICIGSYSLVSMCSIIAIIWQRPRSVVHGQNAYASCLNLVGLLCAQSSIIPCKLPFKPPPHLRSRVN
jgi:hypothetical protein